MDLWSVEAAPAERAPAVDDILGGYGPFFADGVVSLRPEVRRSRRYLLQGVGKLFAKCEEPIGFPAVKAQEMIHRRSFETVKMVPGAGW